MKIFRKTIGLILTGILLFACVVPAFAAGETLYRYDYTKAAQEWKAYARGQWYYDPEGISVVNNDGRTGDDAWYYTYYGNTLGWTDYVIDCDLEGVSEGGIIFRSANPSDQTVDAFDGYYCGTDSDFIFFGKDDNNAWKTIETDGPDASYCYKMGYRQTMHWTIEVKGNQFTLYVDGDKFATAQCVDKSNTYKNGGIAVRYRVYPGDESGYINNLTVSKLASSSGEKSTGGKTESKVTETVSAVTDTSSQDVPDETSNDGEYTDTASKTDATVSSVVYEEEPLEVPVWIWILLGILAVAICAMPVTIVLIDRQDRKRR